MDASRSTTRTSPRVRRFVAVGAAFVLSLLALVVPRPEDPGDPPPAGTSGTGRPGSSVEPVLEPPVEPGTLRRTARRTAPEPEVVGAP